METTVNEAAENAATAGAVEPANVFAYAPEQTQFAYAPEGAETVDASQSAERQGGELPEGGGQPAPQTEQKQPITQKDIGAAYRNERMRQGKRFQREYEQKLASDPARRVGQRLLQDVMSSQNLTQEQAIREIDNRFYDAMAKRENISPAMARMIYEQTAAKTAQDAQQQAQREPAQEEAPIDVNARADEIRSDIASMRLPDGFDFDKACEDQAFLELLLEMPTAAAVRIYHAESRLKEAERRAANAPQAVAEQLRARNAIPQSAKPAPAAAAPDFAKMNSEEFWAWERAHNNS